MISLRGLGYVCLGIITAAIIFCAATLAWFIADRAPPVDVETHVLTPQVAPGGRLHVWQRVTYHRECAAHADRALFDAHTHRQFLPDIDFERPPQGLGTFEVTWSVVIPDDFEPGEGRYIASPVFYCNPLQRYYWPITREPNVIRFEIVERMP